MPVWDQPVTELTTHVIAPVVKKHMFAIIEKMNLQSIFKDNIYINYNYSSISKTKDRNKNINIKNNRFNIDCNVQLNPLNLKWEMTTFKYLPGYGQPIFQQRLDFPIFLDPIAQVELYEQQVPFAIVCNCSMIFLSKSLAYTVSSSLYDLFGTDSVVRMSDIVYDVPIHKFILDKLYAIYELRRIHNHTSFLKYIKVCSQDKIHFNVNRNLNRVEVVANNSGIKMLSSVEFSEDRPSEKLFESSANAMEVQFTYNMQFLRPTQFLLRYPIVIDNRLLPVQHVVFDKTDRIRNIEYTHVEQITQEYLKKCAEDYRECFVTPFYDDWFPPLNSEPLKYTQTPFWIIAVTLDEDEKGNIEKETFVSLKNTIVSKFALHPIIQEIIEIQGCESFEYDCLYNVELYRNHDAYYVKECMQNNLWDIDDVGPIFKTTDYELKYHIVISEMRDLNFLNPKWYFLLDMYGDFLRSRHGIINVGDEDASDKTLRILNTTFDASAARGVSPARVIWCDIIPQRAEIIPAR